MIKKKEYTMSSRASKYATAIASGGKKPAIIVDIDGTIAHRVGDDPRDPYDMTRVVEDAYDPIIGDIAQRYNDDYYIIVVSARTEEAREGSIQFLLDNDFEFDALFMRANGDYRKDSEVKTEIYKECIEPNYHVRFVLDDRNQTVRAWRTLGLKCIQVAEGEF